MFKIHKAFAVCTIIFTHIYIYDSFLVVLFLSELKRMNI